MNSASIVPGVLARPAGGEAVAGLEHERHLDLAAAHGAEARRLVDTWSIATSMNSAM